MALRKNCRIYVFGIAQRKTDKEIDKMDLNQRIQEERNRVSSEIKRLEEENRIDLENLSELKQEYHAAIISSDEIEIDKVNSQIKEVNRRITRRKEKIEAFNDKNNPVIQNIISEEITKWLNEIAELEKEAETLYKRLEPKYKELLQGLREMVRMKYSVDALLNLIKYYGRELNEKNQKKLGVDNYVYGLDNKILKRILPLLIERGQVFKVR